MITTTTVSNDDVFKIVQKLEGLIAEEQPAHVIIACLSVALILQHPEINLDQLGEGVHGMSQWTALFIDGLQHPVEEGQKELMN